MKKTVLLSVLALTASLSADGDLVAAAQKNNGQPRQEMKKDDQPKQVVLTSARPESDNGWYIYGDALYWHADIGQTDWAIAFPNNTSDAVRSASVKSLDFKWSWGFRVGLGVNMDHDMWDSSLSYTWFRTQNSEGVGVPSEGRVRDNIGSFTNSTTGGIKWNVHFNMFDWELGRWYYAGKSLAVRPHVGIKGGWINQSVNVNFTNSGATTNQNYYATEKFTNNFWGVGPSAGVNTMWVLGNAGSNNDHRFALFGDFGGALMYGHYNVKNSQTFTYRSGVTSGGYNFTNLSRNRMATMLQGIMGLSWDTAFNSGRNHFTFKVGYELQYWFRQNQLFSVAQDTDAGTTTTSSTHVRGARASDDLALQGLTVDFRFDF